MNKPKNLILAEQNLENAKKAVALAKQNEIIAYSTYKDSIWSQEATIWRASNKIWLESTGVEHKYADLTDVHLENILRMFQDCRLDCFPAQKSLKTEAIRRGLSWVSSLK